MSYYLDDRFVMDSPVLINLPNDLMTTPVQGEKGLQICHSDSAGKWYVIRPYQKAIVIDGKEVFAGCICSGSWIDISCYFDSRHHAYAPFNFGETFDNKYIPVKYLPMWESVPNGEEIESEDGFIYQPSKDVYKIIKICPWSLPFSPDNPVQNNYQTSFEIFDYGDDLPGLVHDLECFTGLKF